MSERQLRAKYGGKLAKAINRAIRAEIPDGAAALNRLANLAGKANNRHRDAPPGEPSAAELYEKQKRIVAGMAAQIRAKWHIASQSDARPARSGKPRPSPRRKSSHPASRGTSRPRGSSKRRG